MANDFLITQELLIDYAIYLLLLFVGLYQLNCTVQYNTSSTQMIEFAYWKLYCIIQCYEFLPILPTYPDVLRYFIDL